MDRNRLDEIIALIQSRGDFPFDALDVEEDLHAILAHYGVLDDYSLQQEFVIKEAFLALIDWSAAWMQSGQE